MKRICVVVLFIGLLSIPSYSEAEIEVPTGVTASQGAFSDTIRITWDGVIGIRYEVWRDSYTWCGTYPCEPQFMLWAITGGSAHNDSIDILPYGEIFEYRIKACIKDGINDQYTCSDFSLPAYGYVLEDAPLMIDTIDFWGSSGCFIATAAYGSYLEPHVKILRRFRNSYLLTNKLGIKFVGAYYKYSPPMAKFIARHDSLRFIARTVLAPLVGFSLLAINYGMIAAWLVLLCIMTLFAGAFCLVIGKQR